MLNEIYKILFKCQQEKTAREQRIRELEAEAVLQAARAEATAAQLRVLEDQRAVDTAALAEQHKEELTAAHSEKPTTTAMIFLHFS